jgi:hypothetical protein
MRQSGLPLGFILTGGEASDYTAAEPLMEIRVATQRAAGRQGI